MYQRLLNAFSATPLPYKTTGLAFWDDPHISAQMLEAHLQPEQEGASRQHAFMDESARWIAALAGSGSALLDLGCGPGLYAQRLQKLGLQVTGVDISHRSIEYAKEQARLQSLPIRYVRQNYLDFEPEEAYGAAIMIYCDFGVLAPEQRQLVLRKVHGALKPGGLFIVDVFTPHHFDDFEQPPQITWQPEGFWRAEPYLCILKHLVYPASNDYLEQYIIATGGQMACYNLWNHAFTKAELAAQCRQAGFGKVTFYGDAAGSPQTAKGKTLCAVCRKTPENPVL